MYRSGIRVFAVVALLVGLSAAVGASEPQPAAARAALESPAPVRAPASRLSVARERPLDEQPYWKRKPEIRRRMFEERMITVSVSTEKVTLAGAAQSTTEQIRFTMKGAGIVAAPKEFAFRIAQDYGKLKLISPHFKTVEYHAPSRKLLLVTEAFGWQARMVMLVQPVSEDWRDELQWEVIWGSFLGMKGVVAFETLPGGRCEVSLETLYQAESLPLPKFLVGIALEAVTQKVAEKMRTFIEQEYSAKP